MILKQEACLVAGSWRTGDRWIEVDDPATGKIIGRVPYFGATETAETISAASLAMKDWSAASASDRSKILRRFYELMIAHRDELADILTEEQGKPIAEAKSEIEYAASFLEWFAEEAKRVYGDIIPAPNAANRLLVLKQPVGVVGAITPWNFPSAMVTRKIGPALAAGCGVVLKPATQTPFSALALGVLAIEAGLPPALLSIITGSSSEIGQTLCDSPTVRKLSFTGSTEVGARLYAQSAPTIKKLSLELGGNAPLIVFDDADLDRAIAGTIQSKFRNAGQTCVCTNRIYAQSAIYDSFVAALARQVAQLKVGPGNDPQSDIGPLIDTKAVAKVQEHITDALDKGATLATTASVAGEERYFPPTVLRDATDAMAIAREETFGPVAAIFRFDTEAEVIERANATEYGLAAYIFTTDNSRSWRVSEALETGIVGVNTGLISTAVAPFGGVKLSGLGREGSKYGIEDYLETKYVCVGL
jgi:succinate-semialdehyde dehydrogenase / glutarate-semialdehyde dehydrogenase